MSHIMPCRGMEERRRRNAPQGWVLSAQFPAAIRPHPLLSTVISTLGTVCHPEYVSAGWVMLWPLGSSTHPHHCRLEETEPFVVSAWQSKGRFKSTRAKKYRPRFLFIYKVLLPFKKFFKFVLQEETNLYETLCMAVNLIDQMFVRFNTRCLKSWALRLGPTLFWGGRSRFIGNNEISFYTLQVL